MNGVIHEAAQKVYRYGQWATSGRLKIKGYRRKMPSIEELYDEIKKRTNNIIQSVKPRKSVYLAIDGVAPQSKQNQQRQRRFRAAAESSNQIQSSSDWKFDSNCITAGTKFMSDLSANLSYLNWVKTRAQVKISTDSNPGEGEHKLIDFIRKNFTKQCGESFCVAGLDADLIMLCLLLDQSQVYIFRGTDFIDVTSVKHRIPIPLQDFVVISCFVGNDFLPPIPSLEIREDAFKLIFSLYEKPLVVEDVLQVKELKRLFQKIEPFEEEIIRKRMQDESRFPDDLWKDDFEAYKLSHLVKKLEQKNLEKIVYAYVKTVQWVLLYYTHGIPSWNWYYPHHYAPFADAFVKHVPTNVKKFNFAISTPSHPHEQLLRVMPPKSKHLIPEHLHHILLKLPTRFEVDKSGKREEWEAVTIVDFITF